MSITTIDQITNANWQLSNTTFGEVAEGEDDILMCVHNILFTMKGEVPFNPFFGSDLHNLIDKPTTLAGPLIVAEIIDAVGKWEPRVAVSSCKWNLADDLSNIVFTLTMVVVGSATSAALVYNITLNNSIDNKRAFSDGFTNPAFS